MVDTGNCFSGICVAQTDIRSHFLSSGSLQIQSALNCLQIRMRYYMEGCAGGTPNEQWKGLILLLKRQNIRLLCFHKFYINIRHVYNNI